MERTDETSQSGFLSQTHESMRALKLQNVRDGIPFSPENARKRFD